MSNRDLLELAASRLTDEERAVAEEAARQMVRYEGWADATRRDARRAKRAYPKPGRRAPDIYKSRFPEPEALAKPDKPKRGGSAEEYDRAYGRWEEREKERAEWRKDLADSEIADPRGPGAPDRRNEPFPEPTGEDVIDRLTGDDTARWARVASVAITMGGEPDFKAKAGRPKTASEKYGGLDG